MVILGAVPGIGVGKTFADRRALHDANVHRGLMRGIAPRGSSIVLSGGYVDDEDFGNLIIYTGEGGKRFHHEAPGGGSNPNRRQSGPR